MKHLNLINGSFSWDTVCMYICVTEKDREKRGGGEWLEQGNMGTYCSLSTYNNISIGYLRKTMVLVHSSESFSCL